MKIRSDYIDRMIKENPDLKTDDDVIHNEATVLWNDNPGIREKYSDFKDYYREFYRAAIRGEEFQTIGD